MKVRDAEGVMRHGERWIEAKGVFRRNKKEETV